MKNEYYVYSWLRTDGTPYYIGKGIRRRAYAKHGYWFPPEDKSRIVIIEKNLSEQAAWELETKLIAEYGREIDGGILKNKTLGGDGCSGMTHSEETKAIIGEKSALKEYSEEYRAKISRSIKKKIRTPEHNKKISESLKAHERTTEHGRSISASRLNTPKKTCPHCGKISDPGPYKRWHGENCKTLRTV